METPDRSERIISLSAEALHLPRERVARTISLLEEGATVPFISRYRKEATGGLDEVQIERIRQESKRFDELEKRKEAILEVIAGQGKLTEPLGCSIRECKDPAALEDLYLPYKPHRKTRADAARERGLEPLAALLMRQDGRQPEEVARRFVRGDVEDAQAALNGAADIISEWVNESPRSRSVLRRLFASEAVLTSRVIRGKEEAGKKYADYFDWSEPLRRTPSHRLLALLRGEREGFLRISALPDAKKATDHLERLFLRGESPAKFMIREALRNSYRRLLAPSLEHEALSAARERADAEAIAVFAANLRQLLLAPYLGQKRILALDPGFRTGCKTVCLDGQGTLLHTETIYPHPPVNKPAESAERLRKLVSDFAIEAVAIGDGTAGRETEAFVRGAGLPQQVEIYLVSEAGASVYSASDVARREFPDRDVTVRGAVSIGRRLADPLSELVKIDPKSIGVGQYQHDVDQKRLRESLTAVVESCVNRVGVNLNTASEHLLAYVSGLGPALAANIVAYRLANGPFRSRKALLRVPRLGAKAFEQCAGFLRIPDADDPLDNTAVHPESYPIAGRMAADLGIEVRRLPGNTLLRTIDPARYITPQAGLPTVEDIIRELERPGRDPREQRETFRFADVHTIEDLHPGMILPGIVTNITRFGVFVDIGVHRDGMVHLSEIADRYVADPAEAVALRQPVQVRVLDIDTVRKRISLSMKQA